MPNKKERCGMMYKCHCGVEFEPTNRQLGQQKRGRQIHCSTGCQLYYRDENRPRPAKKHLLHLKCVVCGHGWIRRSVNPKQCPACKSILWETGKKPLLHHQRVKIKRDKKEARVFAALNCTKYRECLRGARMNCPCSDADIKRDAYKAELYPITNDFDYNPVNLPSCGRGD